MLFSFYSTAVLRTTAALFTMLLSVNLDYSKNIEIRTIPKEAELKQQLSAQEFLMLKNSNILPQITNRSLTEKKLCFAFKNLTLDKRFSPINNHYLEDQSTNKLVIAEIIARMLALKIWKISHALRSENSTPKNS